MVMGSDPSAVGADWARSPYPRQPRLVRAVPAALAMGFAVDDVADVGSGSRRLGSATIAPINTQPTRRSGSPQ